MDNPIAKLVISLSGTSVTKWVHVIAFLIVVLCVSPPTVHATEIYVVSRDGATTVPGSVLKDTVEDEAISFSSETFAIPLWLRGDPVGSSGLPSPSSNTYTVFFAKDGDFNTTVTINTFMQGENYNVTFAQGATFNSKGQETLPDGVHTLYLGHFPEYVYDPLSEWPYEFVNTNQYDNRFYSLYEMTTDNDFTGSKTYPLTSSEDLPEADQLKIFTYIPIELRDFDGIAAIYLPVSFIDELPEPAVTPELDTWVLASLGAALTLLFASRRRLRRSLKHLRG